MSTRCATSVCRIERLPGGPSGTARQLIVKLASFIDAPQARCTGTTLTEVFMTDNVFHATLIALFLALVGAPAVSYRGSMRAAERMATHRADACRTIASAKRGATHEADRFSCS